MLAPNGGRWHVVTVTTTVMAVATLMQYSLSATSPLVIDDLKLSSPQYGSLFAVYFLVCCLGSLALGELTQRVGAPWGMALVGLAAAAGLAIVASAPGVLLLYAGLILSGIASAFANPATNLALMNVRGRGPLIGIKQSGVQVSALLSGAVVVPVAAALGWRASLYACAVVALLLVPIALRIRMPQEPATRQLPRANQRASILGLAIFAFLMGCGLAATIAYLPLYATHEVGLAASASGQLVGVFGLCAVVGRVCWGYLGERWPRFGRPSVSLGALALGALASTALLVLGDFGPHAAIYVGTALMGLTGAAWNGLVMNLVVASASPNQAGQTSGHVQAAFFGGLCCSPFLLGLVIDATSSYLLIWLATAAVYLMAMAVSLSKLMRASHGLSGADIPGA